MVLLGIHTLSNLNQQQLRPPSVGLVMSDTPTLQPKCICFIIISAFVIITLRLGFYFTVSVAGYVTMSAFTTNPVPLFWLSCSYGVSNTELTQRICTPWNVVIVILWNSEWSLSPHVRFVLSISLPKLVIERTLHNFSSFNFIITSQMWFLSLTSLLSV